MVKKNNEGRDFGYDVLTATVMMSNFRDVMLCCLVETTYISEEHTASFSKIEEQAKQETNKKQAKSRGSCLLLASFLLAYTSTLKTQEIYFNSSAKTEKQNKGYYLEVTFSRNGHQYNIN